MLRPNGYANSDLKENPMSHTLRLPLVAPDRLSRHFKLSRSWVGPLPLHATFPWRNPSALFFLLLALFLPLPASAQVVTGTPPFSSFGGGPDVINLANLNSHIAIPVLHKPGRGTNFDFDLVHDSSVWTPVTSSGVTSWQPASNWGWASSEVAIGYITNKILSGTANICNQQFFNITYTYAWSYVDGLGTVHPFTGYVSHSSTPASGPCGSYPNDGFTAVAPDGSGYTLTVFGNSVTSLFGSDGRQINAPIGSGPASLQDRNGNKITTDATGHFYDTMSSTTPVLTVSGTAPANTTLTY